MNFLKQTRVKKTVLYISYVFYNCIAFFTNRPTNIFISNNNDHYKLRKKSNNDH